MPPKNILFVCPDNAGSSIMAEAYLRQVGRPLARAFSAGLTPAGTVDERALAVLREVGLKTGGLSPKSLETFTIAGSPRMDLAVALSALADMPAMPALPGAPPVLEWRVGDVDGLTGRQDDYLELFAEVRRLVDALLFDLPGVTPVNVAKVA